MTSRSSHFRKYLLQGHIDLADFPRRQRILLLLLTLLLPTPPPSLGRNSKCGTTWTWKILHSLLRMDKDGNLPREGKFNREEDFQQYVLRPEMFALFIT